MKKTFLLKTMLLLCALIVGSSSVWAEESTWTWTATSGALGTTVPTTNQSATGTITSNNKSWNYERTLKSGEGYTGWTSSCIQLGKNGGVENLTLTTSAFSGNIIKSVSIECSSYQAKHNVSIKVGSTTYLATTATASWTTVSAKSGTGTSQGDIEIKFTGGTRALYIKSITVKYEPASTDPSINASTNVDILADDTNGEIPFTISNPLENTHLTATIDAADTWLSNIAVDETNGKVTFDCSVNEDMQNTRQGTIHLVYGDNVATKDVTITQSAMPAKYTVTYETAQEGGTLVIKKDDVTVTSGSLYPAGTVLTIVATPDENYAFHNWQYKKGNGQWVSNTTATTFTMDDNNVEFRANFDPTYPVNFSVNGQVASTARFAEGKKISFPESVTSFGGYVFVGWTDAAVDGSVATKPTLVDTSNETMGTEGKTYYAVYAKTTSVKATFDPNDLTNTPLTDEALTWKDTNTGIELYLSAGQLYTGSPKTFTTTNGTSNYMEIRRDDALIKKVVVTVTSTTYKPNKWNAYTKVEDTSGTTLTSSVSGSNPYTLVLTAPYESVCCFAQSSNQIRATKVEVEAELINEDYRTTLTQPVSIGSYKYASYCSSSALDFTDTGVTAYIVTGSEGESTITKQPVTKVPAGTGLLLKAEQGSYSIPVIANGTEDVSANKLVPVLTGSVSVEAGTEGNVNYVLSVQSGQVVFAWIGSSPATVTAGKAYLTLLNGPKPGASTGAPWLSIEGDDETTGINSVERGALSVEGCYTLDGRRVAQPTKGLYIVNGRKVIIK